MRCIGTLSLLLCMERPNQTPVYFYVHFGYRKTHRLKLVLIMIHRSNSDSIRLNLKKKLNIFNLRLPQTGVLNKRVMRFTV